MTTSPLTKALAACASKSEIRPPLAHVYHNGTTLMASDSFKAVIVRNVPDKAEKRFYHARTLKTCASGLPLDPLAVTLKDDFPDVEKVEKQYTERTTIIGKFDVQYLLDVLKVYKAAGVSNVQLAKQFNERAPLVFTGGDITSLLMPLNR